jgi:hypothetical protein
LPVPEIESFDAALKFVREHLVAASGETVFEAARTLYGALDKAVEDLVDAALAEEKKDRERAAQASPAPAPGTWMLLSKALEHVPDMQKDAELRALLGQIADRRLKIRYFNYGDLSPDPSGDEASPRPPHREEPLPQHFFRLGRVDLAFSAVSFGERTIHGIELFIPDGGGEAAAIDRSPKLGRPGSWRLVREEAERRVASGELFETRIAFARALSTWLKATHHEAPQITPRRIANVIRDLGGVREKAH